MFGIQDWIFWPAAISLALVLVLTTFFWLFRRPTQRYEDPKLQMISDVLTVTAAFAFLAAMVLLAFANSATLTFAALTCAWLLMIAELGFGYAMRKSGRVPTPDA